MDRLPVRSGQKRTRSASPDQREEARHGRRRRLHRPTWRLFAGAGRALAINLKNVRVRPLIDARRREPGRPRSPARPSSGRDGKTTSRDDHDNLPGRSTAAFGPALNGGLVVIEGVRTLAWSHSNGPKAG